jgi:hypothetical protein
MQGPGQSLRQAREAHGRTIEEMSEATGIRLPFLTALEQEAFDSLPGRGFGKLYIRAYAEVLGFDPKPVIEAYDRVVPAPTPESARASRWRPERPAETAEGDPQEECPELTFDRLEDAGEPAAPLPHPPVRSRWWLGGSLFLVVLLPITGYVVFSRSTPDPPPVVARHEPPVSSPPSLPAPPQAEPATPSTLQVAESGIEGKRDHFVSGQRVTFETRVLGGAAGEHIRHVWLRDGKVEQSISLRLGGANWHTFSTKTVGRPGAWAVEARDEQGRVLARADLTVVP